MSKHLSKNKKTAGLIVVLIIIGILVTLRIINSRTVSNSVLTDQTAIVYRLPTCGCCANYISYLRRAGIKVEERLSSEMDKVRRDNRVPDDLTSCHTTLTGGYVVEGHIPIEAIEKLVTERPDVFGIGMPGMPSGSPGMPGAKIESFDISSFTIDGSLTSFLSL